MPCSCLQQRLTLNLAHSAPLTLPSTPTHLLLAAYLASHNPPRLDLTTFTKSSLRRKKRRNPAHTPNHRTTKHRKINRKLLGPQAFPPERWLAIFHAIVPDTNSRTVVRGGGADAMAQVATLQRLGLVVRSGVGEGELGGGKWRVGVGWEVVRGLARSVGFEMEDYLAE
jgi:origin recognition complex subunit 5